MFVVTPVACTTAHRVPTESLIHPDLEPYDRLTITTLDGSEHRLKNWKTTDSTVVVISLDKTDSDANAVERATPYEIRFSSIDYVTKQELDRVKTPLILFGAFLSAIIIAAVLYGWGTAGSSPR